MKRMGMVAVPEQELGYHVVSRLAAQAADVYQARAGTYRYAEWCRTYLHRAVAHVLPLPRSGGRREQALALRDAVAREAVRVLALREERAKRKAPPEPIEARLLRRLVRLAEHEVWRRGLRAYAGYPQYVVDRNAAARLTLLGAGASYRGRDGWTHTAHARWIMGVDDSGRWIVRVPGRIDTVREALEWLEPDAVRRARGEGRWVGRQGDVYLVQVTSGPDDTTALRGTRHRWDPATRTLVHPEHAPLVVPPSVQAVQAYRQRAVGRHGAGYGAD